MTFSDSIIDTSKYIGQLATKTVAWKSYDNVSNVVKDMHHLVPFSIAMGIDLTPWFTWIATHNGEYGLCFFPSDGVEKGLTDMLKDPMELWAQGWVRRVSHAHAHTFLPEWRHVLGSPCFDAYRQTQHAATQLSSIAFEMISTSMPSSEVASIRGQWAYDTLRISPENQWGAFAFKAWAMIGEEEQQRLDPRWSEWYSLFSDEDAFMAFARKEQEPKGLMEFLALPQGTVPDAV